MASMKAGAASADITPLLGTSVAGLFHDRKAEDIHDPLLAKVIAWGENRSEATERLLKALSEFQVEGIKTTIPANLYILSSPRYRSGDLDTGFIDDLYAGVGPDHFDGRPLWPNM